MNNVVREFPTLRIIDAYRDVAEVTGLSPGKEEWRDDEILGHPSIKLSVLSDEEMDKECKIFLTGLAVKMTSRSIASALVLVWNMRATYRIEKRIFPAEDEGADPGDKDLSVFEEEEGASYVGSEIDPIIRDVTGFELRRSTAFLAASTLKMFAKDSAGWMKAWESDHFSKRYQGFTKKPFPLGGRLVPKEENIEIMYEAYRWQRIFLGTLGRILYALADVSDTRQTDMLFEQHLSYTGMHIVPLFIDAKISIGASTDDLLSALDMGQNSQTLLQLKKIINTSLSQPYGPQNRGTWRFATLFDPSAFSLLQTKYVQDTVAILAHINSIAKSSTSTTSNPLNIAVLRQMAPKRLKNAKKVAMNIYHHFTVTASSSNIATQ